MPMSASARVHGYAQVSIIRWLVVLSPGVTARPRRRNFDLLPRVGLSNDVVSGPCGPLARVWAAKCDTPADFSSIASVHPGIGFVRVGGATTVHLRGPQTRATTLSCPRDAEYFGADFRLGAYLPMFPPARLANLQDAMLPILPDGRILLDGRAREMPTPQNLDVFFGRLKRAPGRDSGRRDRQERVVPAGHH